MNVPKIYAKIFVTKSVSNDETWMPNENAYNPLASLRIPFLFDNFSDELTR